jgi:hypothetical protein
MTIFENEEDVWQQRRSEQWMLHGDSTTEYFHRIAREKGKTFFPLKSGLDIIQGEIALLQHATYFYKTLFGP